MNAAPALPRSTWEELVDRWQELDVPEGWRAEIIGERIVMSPPPELEHNHIADLVHRDVVSAIPRSWAVYQTVGVSVPHRSGLFVPDLLVVPREEVPARTGTSSIPAEVSLLAVEITSRSSLDTDRKTKLWSYAHAQVPLYLLIDRFSEDYPTVTLHSEPGGGFYRHVHHVPFGEKIALPEPVDLTLETAEFAGGES